MRLSLRSLKIRDGLVTDNSLDRLADTDPRVANILQRELQRQRDHLELIASENFTSAAVLEAQGSVLTNKYAEGLPRKRYYGGCEFIDEVEQLAIDRAKDLFGAAHVNVSGPIPVPKPILLSFSGAAAAR